MCIQMSNLELHCDASMINRNISTRNENARFTQSHHKFVSAKLNDLTRRSRSVSGFLVFMWCPTCVDFMFSQMYVVCGCHKTTKSTQIMWTNLRLFPGLYVWFVTWSQKTIALQNFTGMFKTLCLKKNVLWVQIINYRYFSFVRITNSVFRCSAIPSARKLVTTWK